MEHLPYIDEHRISIDGPPAAVWSSLLSVLRDQLGAVPAPLARAWGLTPRERRGDWAQALKAGDAIPGFEVDGVVARERLVLVGHHRFSRYALVFELDPTSHGCRLRAQSWAAFPGVAGAAYRAMVIGSRGHRVAVRRLLRSVQRRVARTEFVGPTA